MKYDLVQKRMNYYAFVKSILYYKCSKAYYIINV